MTLIGDGDPERDPVFRSVLADLLRTGLRQCGAIGLIGTLLYVGLSVWGLGYELHWSYRAFRAGGRDSQVVMIALLIVAALSVIGLVLAQMQCSLRVGRLFGVGAVLLTTAVVAFEGGLRNAFSTEYVALAFLLVVAIIPFRPVQVLGIGGGVGAIVYLLGPGGVVWDGPIFPAGPLIRHLAFIGGASVLIAGASAALYRRHRAFAESQMELVEAKEEAERMNRLKSAFLANVSHEIRTPLTSILGFAEAIGNEIDAGQDGDDGGAVAPGDLGAVLRFARLIKRSGQRLMETLDAVLNLSKLEAGEMDLSVKRIDLASRAEEVAEQFRRQAEEKGIHFRVETRDSVRVLADDGALQIILGNLLSNGIKYTKDGGQLCVRVYRSEDRGVLEVEDTGIGMDPENAEDLFEPFRQESEGITREYEGTGLGLAVTRKATHHMNGSIEVETEKGRGTRFTVYLPTAKE